MGGQHIHKYNDLCRARALALVRQLAMSSRELWRDVESARNAGACVVQRAVVQRCGACVQLCSEYCSARADGLQRAATLTEAGLRWWKSAQAEMDVTDGGF